MLVVHVREPSGRRRCHPERARQIGRAPEVIDGPPTTVERARQGDHDAFARLATAAYRRVSAIAQLIVRDPELARDAVPDALIRAWRDLPGLRDPDRFDAWLHRLVVRTCLHTVRARRRRPLEVELSPLDQPTVGDTTAAVLGRDQLDAALRALRPEARALIVLHFYVGLSLPEAAEALDIPLGTAKSRLHRSLGALRVTLQPRDARSRKGHPRAAGMTTFDRRDQALADLLAELVVPPPPNDLDHILAWSNDGTQIVSLRFPPDDASPYPVIVAVDGSRDPIEIGCPPPDRPRACVIDVWTWSPDDRYLVGRVTGANGLDAVRIDTETGAASLAPWADVSEGRWQRVATP